MPAFLLALLGPLGDFILKLINGMKPPVIATESEKAGAATQALQDVEEHDAAVEKAAAAGDAVAAKLDTPGGLQSVAADDPNNRASPSSSS